MGSRDSTLFEVRPSPLHGFGGFAVRWIRSGTRVAEYVGERLTDEDVEARYGDDNGDPAHTFLFRVGENAYVDAARHGNESRFINHSCDPNCESDVVDGRVYITAIRDIAPGEELTYDYSLEVEEEVTPGEPDAYACRCGSPRCRGTMREEPSEPAGDARDHGGP